MSQHERPSASTARKRKRSKPLSFCQRLATQLEDADYHSLPACYHKLTDRNNDKSPLVRLPAELRQEILYHTIDQEELLSIDFGHWSKVLADVCKTV